MSSANRSPFEAIPGKDALLEYQSKSYPAKTYVEKDGLVFKSLTATSATFVSPQWELISDLREVRVKNIKDRNALTGMTATTGTTGIRIPILDNTNVLVLDAAGDPAVGVHEFARYNYNQSNGTWLLLQAGTGATNSNVNDYTLLINKPAVVSGVTVNAGSGMTGGGTVLGTSSAPYAHGGTIIISHADTSNISNINNSGYAYVQKLSFDTFGHVTAATSSTWVHPSGYTATIINTGTTYLQSITINNGHVVSVNSSPWVHPDTSSQADSVNSGNVFIQSIYLDTDGHVIGINTGTATGGGGGGSAITVNGDFGGAMTVSSGGTLNITGGTNVSTIRTGNPANTGIRINVNIAGGINQLQYNNGSGILAASPSLVFSGGTNTLRTVNLILNGNQTLTTSPATGTTSNQFLMRNTVSGLVQAINFGLIARTLVAPPINSIQYNNNGFAGSNNFIFSASTNSVLLNGKMIIGNVTGSTGNNSLTIGANNSNATFGSIVAGSNNSSNVSNSGGNIIVGQQNIASDNGFAKFGFGRFNTILGSYNGAFGYSNYVGILNGVTQQSSLALGSNNVSTGTTSIAIGNFVKATGTNSIAIGRGNSSTLPLLASGVGAINISNNDSSQTVGFGANGTYSGIFGGLDNNITQKFTTNCTVFGGMSNQITGNTYSGVIFGGKTNLINDQPTTTQINNFSVIVGGTSNTIKGNTDSATIVGGVSNQITATVVGTQSRGNVIVGGNLNLINSNSSTGGYVAIVGGSSNTITGDSSNNLLNSGIVNGNLNKIIGALSSSIVGGTSNTILKGIQRSAIIGGQSITLTGSSQNDQVVVPGLMIWNTPATGTVEDVLVWNSTTKKVNSVTQKSLGLRYKNIAYVSPAGNDSTGSVNNMFAPYLTVQAAISNLNSVYGATLNKENRAQVHVLPGEYLVTGSGIGMINYIDLYLDNAHLRGNVTNTMINLPNSALYQDVSIDSSNGKISSTGGTLFALIGSVGTVGNVRINLDEINVSGTSGVVFTSNNITTAAQAAVPVLYLKCRKITSTSTFVTQFNSCVVDVDYMVGPISVGYGVMKIKTLVGRCAISASCAGNLDYYGDIISTGGTLTSGLIAGPNLINSGPYTANFYINVNGNYTTAAVQVGMSGAFLTSASRIRINGSIKSVSASIPALLVSSDHCALIGGTYLNTAGATNSITSTSSNTVYLYGTVVANNAKAAGITTAIGTLIVDPNVV
jgi:hypothetical protein